MAYFKLIDKPEYSDPSVMKTLIYYVLNPEKTEYGLTGGYNLVPVGADGIIEQMEILKKIWHKTEGKQIRHFIVSFAYSERVSEREAWRLAYYIAAYYADCYQILYAVHKDSPYVHIHFVFNPVSIWDGRMYARGKEDYAQLGSHIYFQMNTGGWREAGKEPKRFLLNDQWKCW